jgi:hypothetical protein
MSMLIDLLYLFTYRGSVLLDESSSSHHLLKDRLKKLLRLHAKLSDELGRLIQDKQVSHAMTYIDFPFVEHTRLLGQALRKAKETASVWGSYKTNPKDWYLYLIAQHIRQRTNSANVAAIIALVEASRAAQGEGRQLFNDEDTVRKRIQRYEKRLLWKAETPRSAPLLLSGEEDGDVPF